MATDRLTTALSGDLSLPEGPLLLLRPSAELLVPRDVPLVVRHGMRPLHDIWMARGAAVEGTPSAALVSVPRSKALARALVAEACSAAPLVLVDGQRTDGVDALWKAVRARLGPLPSVAKAHGRLFWFPASDVFADWAAGPVQTGEGWWTAPGTFSEDGPDPASALLADALPDALPGRVADLGAGWGYLSRAVLARPGPVCVDLVEAEAAALDCARLNVTDPRARFHWADATRWQPADKLDCVVATPRFHAGRSADPDLGRAFITAAAAMLKPAGELWLVANRHLPYEPALEAGFAQCREVAGDARFKVLHAARPSRSRRRTPLG